MNNKEAFLFTLTSEKLPIDYFGSGSSRVDPLIFKIDAEVNTIKRRWLHQGSSMVNYGMAAPFGTNIITGWSYDLDDMGEITLAVIDQNLNDVIPPKKMAGININSFSKMFNYNNGDAGWNIVENEGQTMVIYRVALGGGAIDPAAENGSDQRVQSVKWAGTWTIDLGNYDTYTMTLEGSGEDVTGRYNYQNGRISGMERDGKLEGKWKQDNGTEGWFVFIPDSQGKAFTGNWGYTYDKTARGEWSGRRR